MSSSLFVNLTQLPNETYPAAEVIKYLVDVVGCDVISFQRNAHVSYMLVDRARDICNALNTHIQKAESDGDWTTFDTFANAIGPVEDALFKLIAFTEDEKTRHLASEKSVEDCIASAERWATNREQIWSTLDTLETRKKIMGLFSGLDISSRQVDRLDARKFDDKTLFEELLDDVNDLLSKLQSPPPSIRHVHTKLDRLFDKLATESIPPKLVVLIMKSALLIQGVVRMSLAPLSIDVVTQNYLKSTPVWDAAKDLVKILTSTKNEDKLSIDKVRLKYESFLKLLQVRNTEDSELPESYIELLKQAGNIRRPFHCQAVALILLCRELVTKFGNEHPHTAENARSLKLASNETLKALKEAVIATTELKIFETVDFKDHPAPRALATAQNRIKECFYTFGLIGEWPEKEQLISDAIMKDEDRLEMFNEALATLPLLTAQGTTARVKVTVDVCDRTTSGLVEQVTVNVESSARLSAVRWTVAGGFDEQLAKRVRETGEFRFGHEDRLCKLNCKVSYIANYTDSEGCILKLVI